MRAERHDPMRLPTVRSWVSQHGGQLGVWDYLAMQGGASMVVACSYLFWPQFTEVNGCILLAERYEPTNIPQWWTQLSGNFSKAEQVINHVYLWDLFGQDADELPDGTLEELAGVIARCWELALSERYPLPSFELGVSAADEDYGPTIYMASTDLGTGEA
jgi:hypothetical protein